MFLMDVFLAMKSADEEDSLGQRLQAVGRDRLEPLRILLLHGWSSGPGLPYALTSSLPENNARRLFEVLDIRADFLFFFSCLSQCIVPQFLPEIFSKINIRYTTFLRGA